MCCVQSAVSSVNNGQCVVCTVNSVQCGVSRECKNGSIIRLSLEVIFGAEECGGVVNRMDLFAPSPDTTLPPIGHQCTIAGMSRKHFLQFGMGTGKVVSRSHRMGRKRENPNSFPAVRDGNGKMKNFPVVWDGNRTFLMLFQTFRTRTGNIKDAKKTFFSFSNNYAIDISSENLRD